ncbi:nitrate- and nitrite sensing domain-containing protein [Nocardiopsis sp. CNT-189]
MAILGQDIVDLTYELGKERQASALYIADARNPEDRDPELLVDLQEQIKATKRAQSAVDDRLAELGDLGGGTAEDRRKRMVSSLDGLDGIRQEVEGTALTVLPAATKYRQVVNTLNEFGATIGEGTDNAELQESVRALSSLNKAREHLSFESALMMHVLTRNSMSGGVQEAIQNTRSRYENEIQNFTSSATAEQRQTYESTFTGLEVSQMTTVRQRVLMRADNETRLAGAKGIDTAAGYTKVAEASLGLAHDADSKVAGMVADEADQLRKDALLAAVLDSVAVLLVIIATFLVTSMVIRSLLRPLRRLREGALRVADRDLPDSISRMKDTTTTPDQVQVVPIDVGTKDEISEVATSFDQVHRVAMRLASEEAALRSNVNAMFVNLSRRSQTLVERQLRLIDGLEQSEQDSERLSDLFQLDHLATRMRRNAENLLVLSGQDNTRKWAQPVPLVDVLRGAVSEVEQYERVNVRAPSDVSVLGRPVNDVIHLVAELVENATAFSSHDSHVSVTARVGEDGGARVEVTDSGIGMPPEEIDAVNRRLAEPPVIDVAVSRRMGLFVVSRLAARHGIRVHLAEARTGGGVTAVADIPADLLITPVEPSRALEAGGVPDTYAQAQEAFAASPAPSEPDDGWGRGSYAADAGASRPDTGSSPLGDQLPKRQPGSHRSDQGGGAEHPPSGEDLWQAAGRSDRPLPERPAPEPPAPEPPAAPHRPAAPDQQVSRSAGSLFEPRQTGSFPAVPESAPESAAGPYAGSGAEAPRPADGPAAHESSGFSNGFLGARGGGAEDRPADGARDGSPAPAPASDAWPQERAPEPEAPREEPPAAPRPGQWWQEPSGPAEQRPAEPEPREGYGSTAYLSRRYGRGQAPGQNTVVPPSPESGSEALPIFDAIESNWFKRRTSGPETGPIPAPEPAPAAPQAPPAAPAVPAEAPRPQAAPEPPAAPQQNGEGRNGRSEDGWRSDSDRGWKAARSAAEPIAGGLTESGLPKRVPKANLVPGTAPQPENFRQMPDRSADRVRNRFSGFQRGVREGRNQTGDFNRGGGGEDRNPEER